MDINETVLVPIISTGVLLGLLGASLSVMLGYLIDEILDFFNKIV